MTQHFYSHGKLLLSGEYAVLDGALALALPTRYGQALHVTPTGTPEITWRSRDLLGNTWFEAVFPLEDLFSDADIVKGEDETRKVLVNILREARKLNAGFCAENQGFLVVSSLEFPQEWGLGSSSTLVSNLARWARANPYELYEHTFKGSGYDIACALHAHPILYRRMNGTPQVERVEFKPYFKNQLYFVYLNKKQDSREGIRRYRDQKKDRKQFAEDISSVTNNLLKARRITDFNLALEEHEALVSSFLDIPTVKSTYFPDYEGAIKSLGAWGGDFILAAGNEDTPAYFKAKGYSTVIPFDDMIL